MVLCATLEAWEEVITQHIYAMSTRMSATGSIPATRSSSVSMKDKSCSVRLTSYSIEKLSFDQGIFESYI
jgi:hypothetical protein